jgi:uncharacterized membrane protein YkvA (DUF1232 family)
MPDISIHQLMAKLTEIRGIDELYEKAILLYVLLTDGDVPVWVKSIAVGALLYLIDPFDVVPDIAPFIGLLDDLAVLAAALKAITDQIQPHHKTQARLLTYEH